MAAEQLSQDDVAAVEAILATGRIPEFEIHLTIMALRGGLAHAGPEEALRVLRTSTAAGTNPHWIAMAERLLADSDGVQEESTGDQGTAPESESLSETIGSMGSVPLTAYWPNDDNDDGVRPDPGDFPHPSNLRFETWSPLSIPTATIAPDGHFNSAYYHFLVNQITQASNTYARALSICRALAPNTRVRLPALTPREAYSHLPTTVGELLEFHEPTSSGDHFDQRLQLLSQARGMLNWQGLRP